jgi:tRNA(Arg) A34 adenosine deaminase TadA
VALLGQEGPTGVDETGIMHENQSRRSFVVAALAGLGVPLAGDRGGIGSSLIALAQEAPRASPDDNSATEFDRQVMSRAFTLAEEAVAAGDHPFGAVLVHAGEIIAEARNTVETSNDVTKHAETSLVSHSTNSFDRRTLAASTLYSSTEPCVMCCGAIERARVGRLVYGVTARHISTILGSEWSGIPCRDVLNRIDPNLDITGPLSESEGLPAHIEFWPEFIRSRRGS